MTNPSLIRLVNFIRYSLRIRRVEYRIAELPIFLIPVFLLAADASVFTSAPFYEGLLIFLFLFALGDLVNCLADRELDAVYKPQLTEAVYGLGVRGVTIQAIASALAATALAVHLSWLLNRWLIAPSVVAGCLLAVAYSVEPIRLKGQGLWQLAFYWGGLFTGPMLFAAWLINPSLPLEVVLISVAFGLAQTGVILVNTAEDHPEDKALGVRTAIVVLGISRGMLLAFVLAASGAALLVGAFYSYVQGTGGPVWKLTPVIVAHSVVTLAVARLMLRTRQVAEADALEEVRRQARWVPLWITGQALASLVTAILIFSGRTG